MVLQGQTRTRFSVMADYDVNTLSRILELFTIRALVCDTMSARRTVDGFHWVELDVSDVDDHEASVLLNKIRAIITVKSARMETMVLRPKALAAA